MVHACLTGSAWQNLRQLADRAALSKQWNRIQTKRTNAKDKMKNLGDNRLALAVALVVVLVTTLRADVMNGRAPTVTSASDTARLKPLSSARAPLIHDLTACPSILWPPNHRMVPVVVNVDATDDSGVAPCRILAVKSNEPSNGSGDGHHSPDWEIT